MTDLLPPVLETESERLFAGTFIADQGVDTTSCPPAPTLTIPGLQSALSMDSSTDVGTVQLAPESLLKERAGCSGLRRIATSVLPTPAPATPAPLLLLLLLPTSATFISHEYRYGVSYFPLVIG